MIDIFVEENLAGDRTETAESLGFLDAQLAARQRQLQDADQKRADFNAQYLGSLPGTGSLQDRINAARSQLRSEEHTSELPSLMRISYAVFCLKQKTKHKTTQSITT